MKKILATMVLGITMLSLVGCNKGPKPLLNNGNSDSMVFEATTSLSLMSKLNSNNVLSQRKKAYTPTQDEIDEIGNYLEQIDFILLNDNQFKKESVVSDKEEYQYKDIVTFSSFDGEKQTYSLYYVSIDEKQELDDDDDKDDEEIEIKQKIQGIAVFEESTYDFRCEIKHEEEQGESEDSVSFTIYQNENSYIKVEQEFEFEENEYSSEYHYTIVDNGRKIYDYSLEYEEEKENNKLEKDVELKLNGKIYKVKEEKREDGEYFIVKFIDENEDVSCKLVYKKVVDQTSNAVTYVYVETI